MAPLLDCDRLDGMSSDRPIDSTTLARTIAAKLACVPPSETLTTPLGRVRVVRDGSTIHYLPSITTVLKHDEPEALKNWKRRMGPTESKRIVDLASRRGDCIHAAAEKYYLTGKQTQVPTIPSEWRHLYGDLEHCLSQYEALASECSLVSIKLQVSGRFDHLVQRFSRSPRIEMLDIKGKNKIELSNVLVRYETYWMQFVAYCEMLEEFDVYVDRVHLLMCSDILFKNFSISRQSAWWQHFLDRFHDTRDRYMASSPWARLKDHAQALTQAESIVG